MDKESINKRFIVAVNYLLSSGTVSGKGVISDSLDIKPSKFSEILNSRMNVGADLIATLSDLYNIDANWLLNGRGSMLKEEQKQSEEPLVVMSASTDDFVRIPIVDISVAAGSGYNNPDYIEEVECISMPASMIKDGKVYLCVRVKGQSMVPSILDGGYLIIRKVDRCEWEGIRDNYVYVVSDMEGKAYVKRLKNRLRQHGFVVCMSDNADKQNYPNFNIYEEELNTIWYAEWYFSAKIPNIQESYYRKQGELEDRLDELTAQFQQFQKALNSNN
jgi:hypothetical protein bfra3_07237